MTAALGTAGLAGCAVSGDGNPDVVLPEPDREVDSGDLPYPAWGERVPAVRVGLSRRPDSVTGFGVFGAAYALAAAGCVVPVFLGVIGQAATVPLPAGAAVLGAYAAGVTAPLAGITLLTGGGIEGWRSAGWFSRYVKPVAGAVMVAAGLGQLYLSVAVLDVL